MSAGSPFIRALVALGALAVLAWLFFLIEPGDAYDWIKALHVIAVISWMAGMLYLPRLFVYHADAVSGSEKSETFKVMEAPAFTCDHQPGDDCKHGRLGFGWPGTVSRFRAGGCIPNLRWF